MESLFSWSRKLVLFLITIGNLPLPVLSTLQKLDSDLTSITFIGDLHADVGCARQWVEKTGLINLTSIPYQWIGDPHEDAIVFLGDYVDKGSASASVLEFVRSLQETFPQNVLTILGNHDFFLIMDTAYSFSDENPHPLGFPFYDYAYSFMHPEEYLESKWVQDRDDDEEIYGSIVTALQNVYAQRLEGKVHLCAPKCNSKEQADIFEAIAPFRDNAALAEKARERLGTWRQDYAQGLFDSGLLKWMTSQPLVAVVGDALVVHGGVSRGLIDFMARVAEQAELTVADALQTYINEPFHKFFDKHLKEVSGPNSIEDRMSGGYITELILDMVQDRGYFDSNTGCSDLNHVIAQVDSSDGTNVNRIVVGHTPDYEARELCGGKLLASDSSLSRSFRANGNLYCPIQEARWEKYGNKLSCDATPNELCDGSISRITRPSADAPWPSTMERFKYDDLEPIIASGTIATPIEGGKEEL